MFKVMIILKFETFPAATYSNWKLPESKAGL